MANAFPSFSPTPPPRVKYGGWAATDQQWLALTPHQRAAAMALMEADGRRPEDAKNVLAAIVNRAARSKEDIGDHVSRSIYQPVIEPSQRARLASILKDPNFGELAAWSQRRSLGQESDPVNGATHFLAPEKTMLALEAGNPKKYRSWRQWTGYDQNSGSYAGVMLRDGSHAFLAPEGAYSVPVSSTVPQDAPSTGAPTTGVTPMPIPSVEKFGGAANTRGAAATRPFDVNAAGEAARMNIGVKRSQLLADMLNKMAYNDTGPKSNLEGASRVLAAVVGAWAGGKNDERQLEQKKALAGLLGGTNMSPLSQYALSSGDSGLEKSVITNAMTKENQPLDAKSLLLNDLLQQGVPTSVAHAIASKSVVPYPDGGTLDYSTGIKTNPDGSRVQMIDPRLYGSKSQADAQPQGAPGAPGVAVAQGAPELVGGGGSDSRPPLMDLAIDPGAGGMAMPKEQKAKIEEEMGGLAKTEAALQAIQDTIDPRMMTEQGRMKNWVQDTANQFGYDIGVSDPYQAQTQKMAIDQLFNEYRRHVTGAAAAVQELEQLRATFLNSQLTPEQTYAAIETLRTIGRRNYAINRALVQRGLTPGVGDYGAQFDAMSAPGSGFDVDLQGVPERAKTTLQRAREIWTDKDKKAAQEKRDARLKKQEGAAGQPVIPDAAKTELQANPTPDMQKNFDAVFGAGAAAKVLGGR